MQVSEQDKVEYTPYPHLPVPTNPETAMANTIALLYTKFQSKDWKLHFQTLTQMRCLNKHCAKAFMEQVLPALFKQVANQVDNLRSNNSKQALTLLYEIIQHNKLSALSDSELNVLISKLFIKSCSQKGFLKQAAKQAISSLPKADHPKMAIQLSHQTQAQNHQISELAIVTLKSYLQQKTVLPELEPEFFKILVKNVHHGKRALIEKTGKEILALLDKKYSTEKEGLIEIVNRAEIPQQDKDALIQQLNIIKKGSIASKPKGNLKDFLKQKKQAANHDKMQVQQ